jgi:hypothetical protein
VLVGRARSGVDGGAQARPSVLLAAGHTVVGEHADDREAVRVDLRQPLAHLGDLAGD